MQNVFTELKARGILKDCTDPTFAEKLLTQKFTLYCGYDPTGDSLHIGNLITLIGLRRFQLAGHTPLVLLGGATGMIGDPSGKSEERNLLNEETLAHNLSGIRNDINQVLDLENVKIVNNIEWVSKLPVIDFLRDIGKHFRVNIMTKADSVKDRIDRDGEGMSFTEFSYSLLQAFDFLHLFKTFGCRLQIGGSDQWGNITSGIELIRRKLNEQAFGLTFELLLDDLGVKFGKSSGGGGMFLNPQKTSPFKFYQYFRNARDEKDNGSEVERYLKIFTFLPLSEIEELMVEHNKAKEKGNAQIRLATEITRLIHGENGIKIAQEATWVLFENAEIESISEASLNSIFLDVDHAEFERTVLENSGLSLIDALVFGKLAGSKSEARRFIQGGGISLNNKKIVDPTYIIKPSVLANKTIAILRFGKKKFTLLKFK